MNVNKNKLNQLSSEQIDNWNQLTSTTSESIGNRGVCTTYEWTNILEKLNKDKYESSTIICKKDTDITAIFPLVMTKHGRFLKRNVLIPFDSLYSTRAGFITSEPEEYLPLMFGRLKDHFKVWHEFQLTVINDGCDDKVLKKTLKHLKLDCLIFDKLTSPYIELNGTLESYLQALNKKFKYNLTSRLKKLEKIGEVKLKVYQSETEAEEFLRVIYTIERKSWKEQAKTSITTNANQEEFYNNFTPIASKKKWLRGMVLCVDNKPVAYSYGIFFNSVFESLKTSFIDEYKQYAPGNIIKLKIIEYLYEHQIRFYDMLGIAEPIKMKWTKSTYTQKCYTVYNNSLIGKLYYLRALLKLKLKKLDK